jgi:TorA maturation chaperone TorD
MRTQATMAAVDMAAVERGWGRAEAWSRAYALLADVVSRGVTQHNLSDVRRSPLLGVALDAHGAEGDELAVDHQQTFGFSVVPFESAFLDETFTLGGASAERCAESYRLMGFTPDAVAEEPDHLATQLRALSFACGAEADAWQDDKPALAEHIAALSRDFLDEHLLRWLPSFAVTVRRAGRPFSSAVVTQLEQLALLHRAALSPAPRADAFALPDVGLELDDEHTGLAEIARYLSTPARAGLFLSRDDVARIGRRTRVPRGFGERSLLVTNLLRSAAHLGTLPAVLEELVLLVDEHYDELTGEPWQALPSLRPLVEPWCARITRTRALLERIRDEGVRRTAPGSPDSQA